jgi:hypothetical protein
MAPTPRSTKQFLSTAARQWRELVHRAISALEQQRRVQIVVALSVSVICASVLAESVTAARAEREKWLSDVSVIVLSTDVVANTLLTKANTKITTMPLALIPTDALHALPPDTRTRLTLSANTPLSSSLVIPSSESIAIPSKWRVIALPHDTPTPRLTPGDRVDVIIGNTVSTQDSIVISLKPLTLALPAQVIPAVTAGMRVGDVFIAAQK